MYNLSGNDYDMASFDDDTDDEDAGEERDDETAFGHFNRERSIRRAQRRGVTLN